MKAKNEMNMSEEVSMLASTLIQSAPQAPLSFPALRRGESLEQGQARAAAIKARIAAQR